MKSSHIVWHHASVTRERRQLMNEHKGCVIWFTGLSGSGKSTLAHAVEEQLYQRSCRTFVLDGDNVRHGLCSDLGFAESDRSENIRRVGETTKLFTEAGIIALTAFISPFQEDRNRVRGMFPHGDFLEIYCKCPLDVCEQRDVKGLYKRARAGEISQFTGIDSPYEPPKKPELVVETNKLSLSDAVNEVITLLENRGILTQTHVKQSKT